MRRWWVKVRCLFSNMTAELTRSAIVCTDLAVADTPSAHLTKGYETPPTLVPKHEAHALQALKQSKSANAAKLGMFAEDPRKSVERNTAAEVVDMVDADVRCEPAQDCRKVVVRTAPQGRFFKAPIGLMRPERHLELVLHVEQPYSDRPSEQNDG